MLSERDISLFLHTRACAVVMLVIACVLAWVAYLHADIAPIGTPLTIGLSPARDWTSSTVTSLIASVGCSVAMGVMIIYINRAFNVLRSLTSLVAGMFFIMQAALPSVFDTFYGGDVMGVLMLFCTILLFSSYGDPVCQRRIYLIFMLLSLAAFTDLSYILYLPVFLLGCVQMRVFNFRTLLAAGMGLITPPWILFGFGIVTPSNLHWPTLLPLWEIFQTEDVIQGAVVAAFTLICGVGFTVANLLKILSYNSRVRAFNGFLTMVMGTTGVFILLNFNNFAFYIPLLNCMSAYQIAHFFTYRRSRRSYIPILLTLLVYIGFYIWTL